ncbi:hypothetical protein [Clostridium botulinum]|uniref:hypothetical protein n=1 Tax=Clostridium botulinum TaxID=1491 RepID=UPI000302E83C|nr:hypothetical protein [Clostridium botulinum]KLU74978.1 hypothetical protein CBC3_10980 [Clostridium botulinum V891]KOA77969.1 hypothetical protein ADU78_02540 [Clostridium botulinum]KOA95111.1 hypothetical protein ADU76_01745 [Clostridium botulinum]MCD3201826.1 hypothetical protein [Clostridium botulinum C/D]MCD3221381.1 hypothetical protein [Clostridium botulinum C/D]
MKNAKIVILRNKVYDMARIDMNIRELTGKKESIEDLENLRLYFGEKKIMKDIFDENIDSCDLKDSKLYKSYLEVLNTGNDNEDFFRAYKITEQLAVKIDQHIHICPISYDTFFNDNDRLLPWHCIEAKIYLADSWWDTDEEILEDFRTLSFLDFIIKHKVY